MGEKSSEEEGNHICQIIQGISFLVLIGWLLRMKYAVFSVLFFESKGFSCEDFFENNFSKGVFIQWGVV